MLAAGLLAKKAVRPGLKVPPHVKTSLAPGSRIVTEYLTKAGLLPYLEQLGFAVAGLRLHHLHRQRRRPGARVQQADHRQRPDLRGGAVGQPQLRGTHPPESEGQLPGQPAAGGGLRDRRHRAARPDDRAGGPRHQRARRLPRRHLADHRRGARAAQARDEPEGLPPTTARSRASRASCGARSRACRARSTTGRPAPTSPGRRSSTRSRCSRRCAPPAASPASRARASSPCSATRSPPTTFRRPARSRTRRRPASTCCRKACSSPTSTATARAAATTS